MENSKGFYVYGIVLQNEMELPQRGMDPEAPVRLFHCEKIAAVVSEVPLAEFGESALAQNLKNMEWMKEKIWAHEKVLESVMDSRTVIPLKFGTIFLSEERLEKVLRDSYEAFGELLEKLEGHSEWAVKVYGHSEGLKASVEKGNPRVQAILNEMAGKPAGVAYLLKKKLETALAEETDVEKGRRLQEIFNRLSAHASDGKLGELSPRELTGKEMPMIFNGIFLVAKEKLAPFTQEVASLKKELSDLEWEFQQVGPFPPYNFSGFPEVKEANR